MTYYFLQLLYFNVFFKIQLNTELNMILVYVYTGTIHYFYEEGSIETTRGTLLLANTIHYTVSFFPPKYTKRRFLTSSVSRNIYLTSYSQKYIHFFFPEVQPLWSTFLNEKNYIKATNDKFILIKGYWCTFLMFAYFAVSCKFHMMLELLGLLCI